MHINAVFFRVNVDWVLVVLIIFSFSGNIYSQGVFEPEKITGGNSPDDFNNFSNVIPNPDYTGDANYSIKLASVKAGGGLDFPLVLTYNSSRIRERAKSGYVGFGWDLNIGEVVRSVNNVPDEQKFVSLYGESLPYDLGPNVAGTSYNGYLAEVDGITRGGDLLAASIIYPDEWDNYNVSTPYDTKSLVPVRKSGESKHYFLERPYNSWFVNWLGNNGSDAGYYYNFAMIDDLGRTFVFDHPHFARIDRNGNGIKDNEDYITGTSGDYIYHRFPISWKITSINSPNTDYDVQFIYDDYAHAGNHDEENEGVLPFSRTDNYNDLVIAGKSVFHDILGKVSYDESVISKIETKFQTVKFFYDDDLTVIGDNNVKRKILRHVEVVNKSTGELIEKVELQYSLGSHPLDDSRANSLPVNMLTHVKFKNVQTSSDNTHYSFEYYHDEHGQPECTYPTNCLSPPVFDYFGYLGNVNLLEKIHLPTGGEVIYQYDERLYDFSYSINSSGTNLYQKYSNGSDNIEYRAGVLVRSIEQSGSGPNSPDIVSPDIVKTFSYGDGVRIENDYQGLTNFDVIMSTLSSRLMGHIAHRWVEIKDSEGGFTKNYYTTGISNFNLHSSRCENTTNCPSDVNEEEAKSIYFGSNGFKSGTGVGGAFLYDTYDEMYGKVYKSETGYYIGSNPTIVSTTESSWDAVDSDFKYPAEQFSDARNLQKSYFPYKYLEKNVKDGKETKTYYANFNRGECSPQFYEHRFRADILDYLGPPKSEIIADTFGESILVKRTYFLPENDGYEFGLAMCGPAHLVNIPVGTVTIRDASEELGLGGSIYQHLIDQLEDPIANGYMDKYPLIVSSYYQNRLDHPIHSGIWTKWNDSDGYFRPRETYVIKDTINYNGGCYDGICSDELDQYARKVQTYDLYNTNGDIIETSNGIGLKYSYDRALDGSLIGIFSNSNSDDVFAHSFEYEGLNGWVFSDFDNEGGSLFEVENGRLKISSYGSAAWGDKDRIIYTHPIEISGTTVWEFDVQIADTDSRGFFFAAGGDNWSNFSAGSQECAIWATIANESLRYWVNSSATWNTVKTGSVGEIFSVRIEMNSDNNKASYYVNGELLVSDVPYQSSSTGIKQLVLGTYGDSSNDADWYVDNVRFYPIEAQAISQELAANGRPVTIKSIDGFTERFDYDGRNRLSVYTNKTGTATSVFDYNLTSELDGNGNHVYNSSNPNTLEVINTANIGPDDYLVSRKRMERFESNPPPIVSLGDIDELDSPSEFSVALWFNRYRDYNNPTENNIDNILVAQSSGQFNDNLEIGTDGENIEIYLDTGSGSQEDTNKSYPAGIKDNAWYHLALTYSSVTNKATLYLNGVLKHTWTNWTNSLESSDGSPLSLGIAEPEDDQKGIFEGLIAEFRIYEYALSADQVKQMVGPRSVSYFDGIGRSIQSQTIGGEERIVTGQLYDERGLPIVTTRPIISESGTSGFIPDLFGTSFNPGSALSGTEIDEYYDPLVGTSDGAYAYSYTQYEDSKTNRILSTTLPGEEHRFGNNNENNFSFDTNSVSISTPNKTWTSGNLYKTISNDPENKQSISYTNYLGQTVASGVDWDSNGELNGTDDLVTTFEYDYNGNLILVEDPSGLLTTYNYNALGELLEKKLPDQDHPNKYCYDDKGRLRFHADPNDFANPFYYSQDHYSYTYTKYDEFDRPIEIGEQDASFVGNNSQASFDIICANSSQINDQNEPSANNNPMIIYSYDGENAASGTRNHKGRLSRTQYKDPNTSSWGYTWYSYNELGLVEMIRQRMPGQNNYNDRTISYTYDELGRLVHVAYDEGYSSTGDHHFWYYYDGFGRLSKITSHQTNSPSSATTEAEYTYYADGQVEQLILGDGVQTIEYDYTIQGWLEDINNGTSGGGDVFSTILEYDLSGNIAKNTWYQKGWYTSGLFPAYNYEYDNANRIVNACYGSSISTTCPETSMSDFDVTYDYDKNGNITSIERYDQNGSMSNALGDLDITYESNSNRMQFVFQNGDDTEPVYDANGNIIEYDVQGITDVTYDWRNLPTKVIANGTTINYTYDAEGNRVKKEVVGGETTYYIRGVDGQTFAAYSGGTIKFLNILAGGEIIGQIIKN